MNNNLASTPASNEAWRFWQETSRTLDELQDFMDQVKTVVLAAPGVPVPPPLVGVIRLNIRNLETQFTLLVHTARQKSVR